MTRKKEREKEKEQKMRMKPDLPFAKVESATHPEYEFLFSFICFTSGRGESLEVDSVEDF